jgi:leucyl-tRNA synthetase
MFKYDRCYRQVLEPFVKILAPFAPHLGEELWSKLGHEPSIFKTSWPEADLALSADEEVKIVIQVNGKLRGDVVLPVDTVEEEVKAKALSHPNVKRYIEGKEIVKVLVVPNRIVSIVTKG